jgi:hypothetical protein
LLCQHCQILLSALQGGHLFTRRALEVHPKQDWPDKNPDHASGDVLGDLRALVPGQFLNLRVVGLSLGDYRRAIGVPVLGLNNRHGLRRSPRARAEDCERQDSRKGFIHNCLPI